MAMEWVDDLGFIRISHLIKIIWFHYGTAIRCDMGVDVFLLSGLCLHSIQCHSMRQPVLPTLCHWALFLLCRLCQVWGKPYQLLTCKEIDGKKHILWLSEKRFQVSSLLPLLHRHSRSFKDVQTRTSDTCGFSDSKATESQIRGQTSLSVDLPSLDVSGESGLRSDEKLWHCDQSTLRQHVHVPCDLLNGNECEQLWLRVWGFDIQGHELCQPKYHKEPILTEYSLHLHHLLPRVLLIRWKTKDSHSSKHTRTLLVKRPHQGIRVSEPSQSQSLSDFLECDIYLRPLLLHVPNETLH